MQSQNDLINSGFYRIDPNDQAIVRTDNPNKAVLIIGPARSATSMAAGALFHLGYYCGDKAVAPVFEDVRLRETIKQLDWKSLKEIANSYSNHHDNWLFKWTVPAKTNSISRRITQLVLNQPSELKKLTKLYHTLGKPKVIVTYKDVFSISNRNRISISSDILDGIHGALAAYENIRLFIKKERPDVLMIASEKALKNKNSLVDHLIDFCEINATSEQQQAALNFIEPIPWQYLASTKSDQCIGYVEPVKGGNVNGWAKYKDSNEEANVVLFINDKAICSAKANGFRADLKQAGHRNGNCAFSFCGLDPAALNPGATVRVRVEGDSQDLSNSPQVVQLLK